MLHLLFSILILLVNNPVLKASSENNKIYFSNKSDFSTSTNEFDSGEKVYIKIITSDLNNLEGKNDFILTKTDGSDETTGSFEKIEDGKFSTNFNFPSSKDLYYLKIRLKDDQNHKFEIDTNLYSKYQFKKSRFFEDSKFKNEKEEFENDQDIFYKGYLGNFDSNKIQVDFKDTEGTIKTLSGSDISNRSDWLELVVAQGLFPFLTSKGLYSLIVKDTENNSTVSKYFYITKINPVALITSPVSKASVKGQVEVSGTAFSSELDYYELKYKKNGDNDWTSIKKASSNVINDKLGTWDTGNLGNGKYDLLLTVKSLNGDSKEYSVDQISADSFSGDFKIRVPQNAGMGTTVVKTVAQTITGKVGDSNSRGISVQDDRGTFDGWSLTVSGTDFYSGSSVIEVNNLTVEPKNLITNTGSDKNVNLGSIHQFTSDADPTTVMYAQDGYGTGTYYSTLNIIFNLPPNVAAGSYKGVLYFTLL